MSQPEYTGFRGNLRNEPRAVQTAAMAARGEFMQQCFAAGDERTDDEFAEIFGSSTVAVHQLRMKYNLRRRPKFVRKAPAEQKPTLMAQRPNWPGFVARVIARTVGRTT